MLSDYVIFVGANLQIISEIHLTFSSKMHPKMGEIVKSLLNNVKIPVVPLAKSDYPIRQNRKRVPGKLGETAGETGSLGRRNREFE